MSKIKTKDVVSGTIKTIDKAAVATERMKNAYAKAKDKAESGMYAQENSSEEYAADRLQSAEDHMIHEAGYAFDKAGRKGVDDTKRNFVKAKDNIQAFKEKRAEKALKTQSAEFASPASLPVDSAENRSIPQTSHIQSSIKQSTVKTAPKAEKTIKQSVRSSGKKTIKTLEKVNAKTVGKSVKTAEQTAKASIKTSQQTAQAAQRATQTAVKNSQKAAQAARQSAKTVAAGVKAAAKATAATIKAMIASTKALIAAIAAGGWIAVTVIIVICLVALLASSVFGIFFSGENVGGENAMTMQSAVQEINADYDTKLQEVKDSVAYDTLEMSGSRAVWKEVLAVYAVKTNTDSENPQEVATMDEEKKELLSNIFWEMNEISSHSETKSETIIEETDDGHGNIVQTEKTEIKTILYVTVTHKTADEMATQYGFNEEQRAYLAELLRDENNSLWAGVLYGIRYSDDQIVTVALSQVGNVGGDPYWSWYGFNSRVEWCACFVSWCANECGYIDAGVIPKYAGCVNGVQWFKDRGQWADGSEEPVPGMIIFFDWDNKGSSGPQDGEPDHTGIVQKVENGMVYTVEGNSGDSCRINSYPVGHYEILGYGVPAY